jgi:nicotinamide-nucleotide amidase
MLGVSPDTLARCGAVSEATVREMAAGALTRSRAQAALAITGVAGPGGGSPRNPVGTVWFAWAVCVQAHGQGAPHAIEATARHQFAGDRDAIRRQAVQTAMQGMLERAGELPDVPRQPA